MAKRITRRYSPDNRGADSQPGFDAAHDRPTRTRKPARHPLQWRTNVITYAAIPLLIGAFFGDALHLAHNLAAFAIIAGAMFLTREGLIAEAAYDAARNARRPAIPRKLFGMVATGIGLGFAGWRPEASLLQPIILGGVGAVLHRLAFGSDPMRDKGMEGLEGFQLERVQRLITEGEGYLDAMDQTIARLQDRRLKARVAHFAATAQDLFDLVRENPGSLAAARRYLGVYLMGARDATVKFTDQYEARPNPAIRAEYEALLDDLEANFTAHSQAILEGGRDALEVEVQVLRDRLAREGVHMPATTPENSDD